MENIKIAVIGLGYVGLPLARLFATKFPVIGFDINQVRINELNAGIDKTLEVSNELLQQVLVNENPISSKQNKGLYFSSNLEDLKEANIYIVTVPTPIDRYNRPDLTPLYKASETVAKTLNKGDIIIYESTVYPGVTEEECIPVVEKVSGLKFNTDFYAGYSPERINPGDKLHTVDKILKVTSGSTPEVASKVDNLYKSIITAGTHLAPSIKVAEASKVIENAQRDINIAFINELTKIFALMHIDIYDVLEAAGTKWNFLPFKPGLVGGHCIGVDPFYLAQKAQDVGYYSELILTARRVNDSMGSFISAEVIKKMIKKDIKIKKANILILGFSFKENCPDIRNTKVIDVIDGFNEYECQIDVFDPWVNASETKKMYKLDVFTSENELETNKKYDVILEAVAHNEFKSFNHNQWLNENGLSYYLKSKNPY